MPNSSSPARRSPSPRATSSPASTSWAAWASGLKAGTGFRVFAAMEFADFSRFVARSVDALVDGATKEAASGLPSADAASRALLQAARPAFKIALRTAYELGEFIALNAPQANAAGAEQVSLRCAQVALEEGQRFLLEGLTDAARAGSADGDAGLDGAAAERPLACSAFPSAARSRIISMAFPPNPSTARRRPRPTGRRWSPALSISRPRWRPARSTSRRSASFPFCGRPRSFALIAARRVTRADASLSVIGLPPREVQAPFRGTLTAQPPRSCATISAPRLPQRPRARCSSVISSSS